jgi:signal peptidase I
MNSPYPPGSANPLRGLRSLTELTVGFVIAVILLRGLILEGYLISTGSMAPGLLGYHKQVTCPTCEHVFAFGISFDESVDSNTLSASESELPDRYASCPNCGQVNIDVSHVPTNHGDQLLVHKNVFDLRQPHRWETVVFRNPQNPGEAYVKRVVGLPGETIRILDGNLFVGGEIARKDYATQRDMRIPVFALSTIQDSDEWELPWQLLGQWNVVDGTLTSQSPSQDNASDTHWIQFRNWRWYGGNHTVEVPLSVDDAVTDWNSFLDRFDRVPVSWATRIAYDRDAEVLRCQGVMPEAMLQDLVGRGGWQVQRKEQWLSVDGQQHASVEVG